MCPTTRSGPLVVILCMVRKGSTHCISGVTVGISRGSVDPTPVGINNDLAIIRSAATTLAACLPGHTRMDLSLLGSNLLALNRRKERREKKRILVNAKRSSRHC